MDSEVPLSHGPAEGTEAQRDEALTHQGHQQHKAAGGLSKGVGPAPAAAFPVLLALVRADALALSTLLGTGCPVPWHPEPQPVSQGQGQLPPAAVGHTAPKLMSAAGKMVASAQRGQSHTACGSLLSVLALAVPTRTGCPV